MKARKEMTTLPVLKTDRLELRQIRSEDIASLVRQVNDPTIAENILNIPYPYTEADAILRINFVLKGFENRDRFVFVITEKDELIGEIGLHLDVLNNKAEMGYWIASSARRKGIASEAVAAILQFGFNTIELQKIFATHFMENPSSGNVLLNNHMIKEAELKDHYKHNNRYGSVIQYRLTKEEYSSLQN